MGLFGPTYEEFDTVTQQLNAARAEHDATKRTLKLSTENEARLIDTANMDAGTIRDLRTELANNKIANEIGKYASRVIDEMEESGEIDFAVEATARAVVTDRTIAQITASLVNELIKTEYARLAAKINPDLEDIRAKQKERLTLDGTFAALETNVKHNTRTGVMADELALARQNAEAKWSTPEAQAELRTELEADTEFMKQVALAVEEARQNALRTQKSKFKEEAVTIAEAEIAKGEAMALEEYMDKWKKSSDGRNQIAALERKLERQVAAEGQEIVLAQTQDAKLKELYAERDAQLAKKLATEILIENFTTEGIDTNKIPAGSRLELYLGSTEIKDEYYYDPAYGGNRRNNVSVAMVKRYLRLVSQGDGKFSVSYDSLGDATSPYELNDAIDIGTIIILGQQQVERDTRKLDSRIAYGIPLFYDTDDTDTNISPMQLKVQVVKLNGTVATVDAIKKVTMPGGASENLYTA